LTALLQDSGPLVPAAHNSMVTREISERRLQPQPNGVRLSSGASG